MMFQLQPESSFETWHQINMNQEEDKKEDKDDVEEGETVIVTDKSGKKRTRGKTTLAKIWNLPEREWVVVNCNDQNQPIAAEGGLLGQFLGTIARKGDIVPLHQDDWRHVKNRYKPNILEQVKEDEPQCNFKVMVFEQQKQSLRGILLALGHLDLTMSQAFVSKFQYPPGCQKWILQSVGKKWKDYKCNLKALYFDESKELDEQLSNVPPNVESDQWATLVTYWRSDLGKKRSQNNKRARSFQKSTHTAGTKSFARVRDEMKHKHKDKVEPSCAELYLQVYKRKDGSYQDEQTSSIMQEKLTEQHDKSPNSQGSVAWEGDAFSQVMGKEKHGCIHGLGLGPTPTEIWGMSAPHQYEEFLRLQEKVDSMQGIITNLQASDSAKSSKARELEDRLTGLEVLFNERDGPSRQTAEAELESSSQQRKIEELEAQLSEAEGIILDLREELQLAHEELERVKCRRPAPTPKQTYRNRR